MKNNYFFLHPFLLISAMFVSWESSNFKLRLTLGNLFSKNIDKKSKCYYKNVNVLYDIKFMGYKKLIIYYTTTLKVNVVPQSQVTTGVFDSVQLISAFKYLGTIQLRKSPTSANVPFHHSFCQHGLYKDFRYRQTNIKSISFYFALVYFHPFANYYLLQQLKSQLLKQTRK